MKISDTLDKIFNLRIEATFFVASLPFVGYLVAYFSKYGFYDYLEVPSLFIKVGIEDIIGTIVPLAAFTLVVLFVFVLIRDSKSNEVPTETVKKSQDSAYLSSLLIITFLCGILIAFVFYSLQQTIIIKILISVGLSLTIVLVAFLPRIYFPGAKNFKEAIKLYNEKLRKQNAKLEDQEIGQKGSKIFFSFDLLPESKVHSYGLYFAFVVMLCFVSFLLGKDHAGSKDRFLIYIDDQKNEYIVVGIYDESMVSVMIDEARETRSRIKLIPLSDSTILPYQYTGVINSYKKAEET